MHASGLDSSSACPLCDCQHPDGRRTHVLLAWLNSDDLDLALDNGLLDAQPCPQCAGSCNTRLLDSRNARRAAFAARERFNARAQRLARRAEERAAARTAAARQPAALPPAAAAALARAKAKVARKP